MENYEVFYKKSKDGLFAYLLRMTGDYHLSCDLVQESFVRYLQRYRNISERSRALLYTIARNAAMDSFRKPKADQLEPENHATLLGNPEQQFEDRQTYCKVMAAIQQLPVLDRELIALLCGADLTYAEIGRILNISEINVKVKVHRARLKLNEILADNGGK